MTDVITAVVDVGTPPTQVRNNNQWIKTEVRFHQFASLSNDGNAASAFFNCMGRRWKLTLWPYGYNDTEEGMVSLYICHHGNQSINNAGELTLLVALKSIDFGFTVKDSDEKEVVNTVAGYDLSTVNGTDSFTLRETLLGALNSEGTLTIEVRMRDRSIISKQLPKNKTKPFVPNNLLSKNILQKFMHEESADVIFEVGTENDNDGERSSSRKRTKTSTSIFVHRFILQDIPTLAELCKASVEGNVTTVLINDVKPEIFKHMIYYCYGGKLSDEELKNNAKDLINACNKYGVVNLKLEAEAYYVKVIEITVENMMDNLLYSESMNCALLKEAVIDFVVENGKDVLEKVSLKDVPGSVFADLLTAVTRDKEEKNSDTEKSSGDQFSTMRVSELRIKLNEKGLDVDGSREAMIAALKATEEVAESDAIDDE